MSEPKAADRREPGAGSHDDDTDHEVVSGGGYRFPPRNPHTGAAIGLLRPQFGAGGR